MIVSNNNNYAINIGNNIGNSSRKSSDDINNDSHQSQSSSSSSDGGCFWVEEARLQREMIDDYTKNKHTIKFDKLLWLL